MVIRQGSRTSQGNRGSNLGKKTGGQRTHGGKGTTTHR